MPTPRPACIHLSPDAAVLVQDSQPDVQVPLQGGLHEAITSLVEPVRHTLRADVVVHAVHARIMVLPFSSALTSQARWSAYAARRFEDAFGESLQGWQLRVVPERPPRPRLAAALPMGLVRTLQTLLGERLRSVRIGALVRLDELRGREAGYTGALVERGKDHAFIALMVDGVLQRVRLCRTAADMEGLRAALKVEWALLGRRDPLPALAYVPQAGQDAGEVSQLAEWARRCVRLH